ncbi:MAG: hypothetical protein CSA68_08885 [Rhodobacterales bacterium]|nr:MAG: hypothetical protein CSA68_08885 [Rhodobacterales bacterium]
MRRMNTTTRNLPYLVTAIISLAMIVALLLMGRVPICECGTVKLWYFELMTSEGSQHLIDWYTPSHLLHGIIFYALLWLFARHMPIGWRLAIATLIEALWEVVENTPAIIERYREVTIALDYYGDSVVNSAADLLAMLIGFWLARRLPVWASVAVVVGFEVLTTVLIRDGLALNIIMLVAPFQTILDWQSAL